MNKAKQSPSSNDGLGTKRISDMLKSEDTLIIMDSLDPVKLIAAHIRYQILVEKMYRQNTRRR